jgi:hypothetical protein
MKIIELLRVINQALDHTPTRVSEFSTARLLMPIHVPFRLVYTGRLVMVNISRFRTKEYKQLEANTITWIRFFVTRSVTRLFEASQPVNRKL